MKTEELQIVVVQSGWVFVGKTKDALDSSYVTLSGASCIRVWGTKAGLGELAYRGPQKETILDKCGTVRVPRTSVVAVILCDKSVWPK
jgi:hypothetical protein